MGQQLQEYSLCMRGPAFSAAAVLVKRESALSRPLIVLCVCIVCVCVCVFFLSCCSPRCTKCMKNRDVLRGCLVLLWGGGTKAPGRRRNWGSWNLVRPRPYFSPILVTLAGGGCSTFESTHGHIYTNTQTQTHTHT